MIIGSPSLMQAMSTAHRREGRTVGFVPTMGALHDGHMALIREARLRADFVVVSIFVNPKQFDKEKDLNSYPHTLEADLKLCHAAGVDVVLSPPVDAIYPAGYCTNISAGPLGRVLEGRSRNGHFDGVCTVLTSFFSIVQPHFAVFGEKDFQQLLVVKRLVRDLHFPIEIVPIPVLRDIDGLALSSRNVRLNKRNRQRALCLFKTLSSVQERVFEGEVRARVLLRDARARLKNTPDFKLDYCLIVEPYVLNSIETVSDGARLLLAGTIGTGKNQVRLLDNSPLFIGGQ
ncbi:MAG: pantoate--beta-alanine ligase [Deltaproteobacteria bacterium]|nr:pantoate--beta-alanine ligase [Deltaproteobacteria bacterium]